MVFREVMGLFKGRDKQQGKVCPNGHVMHPSWDSCPYCLEIQQAMSGGGGGGMAMPPVGAGTAMLNVSDLMQVVGREDRRDLRDEGPLRRGRPPCRGSG